MMIEFARRSLEDATAVLLVNIRCPYSYAATRNAKNTYLKAYEEMRRINEIAAIAREVNKETAE